MKRAGRFLSLILVLVLMAGAVPECAAYTYTADYRENSAYGTTGASYTSSFYDLLTPLSRLIYDAVEANIETLKTGTATISFDLPAQYDLKNLPASEMDFYSDAIAAFKRDHCEVFWVDFSKLRMRANSQGGAWHVNLTPNGNNYFISDFTDAAQVTAACSEFDASLAAIMEYVDKNSGKVAKLEAAHDWLIRNNSYNTGTFSGSTFESYSAIIGHNEGNGRPVCEGYAKAFKVICDELGIPCVCITGMGFSSGRGELHMWNAVKLNNAWYAVDITWDDPLGIVTGVNDDFFLVGSDTVCRGEAFSKSHAPDAYITASITKFAYPTLNSEKFSVGSTVKKSAGMENFKKTAAYTTGMFRDVKKNDWFEENIRAAYELELMVGYEDGTYGVNDGLTIAQTLAIAARIHAIYNGAEIDISNPAKWYDPYVDYCLRNGIIYGTYDNYDAKATRAQFANILARSLPSEELTAINTVSDGAIPDVDMSASYAGNVYLLYRAGILAGNDEYGTFGPETGILRCQAAAIITRMADTSLRVSVNIG